MCRAIPLGIPSSLPLANGGKNYVSTSFMNQRPCLPHTNEEGMRPKATSPHPEYVRGVGSLRSLRRKIMIYSP